MQSFHHNIIPWTAGRVAVLWAFWGSKTDNYRRNQLRAQVKARDDAEYNAMLARVAARKRASGKGKALPRMYNSTNKPAACRYDGGLKGGARRWK